MDIILKKWNLSFADDLVDIFSDQEIYKYLNSSIPYPYTKKDAVEYIELLQTTENKFAGRAIVLEEESGVEKAIGSIVIVNLRKPEKEVELGYCLGKKYWSKGIMTQAVKRYCSMLFAERNIDRIIVKVNPENIGSVRVLEKSGFAKTGFGKGEAARKIEKYYVFSYTR